MGHAERNIWLGWPALLLAFVTAFGGVAGAATPPAAVPQFKIEIAPATPATSRVMLGIDVLEANGFAELRGKKVGLLTHPAGVDRTGRSTIEVLRHAPGVKLVALFGPEHGIRGDAAANADVANSVDAATGLPVFSLFGGTRKPTKPMLRGIDVFVIDLQDIGSRSYTFTSAMRRALEGCFENDVEVIVLDRPNPLGGVKVAGPLLDVAWSHQNYVGAFRVPYVHGLTIGELARMTKGAPSPDFPDAIRQRGKLTVIPMRGWDRTMRWPETGLKWVPTSGLLPDWEAVQGYPMVGLATFWDPPRMDIGFRHGLGPNFPYRGLSFKGVSLDVLERELRALDVPGVRFRRVQTVDRQGQPMAGMYVDIVDYEAWQPTELNVHLMKLACRLGGANPFTAAPGRNFDLFLRHLGSAAFLAALAHDGANLDARAWMRRWQEEAAIYRRQSRKYWLY
jgi:uncharacterized protein YbbC (DUF1343 family)